MSSSWRKHDLVLVLLITAGVVQALSGDHVCERLENYTETVREAYTQPVLIHTTSWCLQIPPRCLKSVEEERTMYRTKSEVKQRRVNVCCEGFVRQRRPVGKKFIDKCVLRSNCMPGYIGSDCKTECPTGRWGINCIEACDCEQNGACNPIDGTCHCRPGWHGPRCSLSCDLGKWGENCSSSCACSGGDYCHPVSGDCFPPVPVEWPGKTPLVDLLQANINDDIDNNFPGSSGASARLAGSITSSSMTETTPINQVINEYHEGASRSIDVQGKDDKSTPGPFLAVVHVSASSVTDFDTIVTPISSADKIPIHGPLPTDVIALIGIGCIISLGVTTLAILAIVHVRSKLYESIRLSIYETEKRDCTPRQDHDTLSREKRQMSAEIGRRSNSEYETPRCIVPPERPGTLPRASSALTRESTYSNQYPNIQLFSSIRELLEAHYDRPPATTTFHQPSNDIEGEHLYDEIPLQSTTTSTVVLSDETLK